MKKQKVYDGKGGRDGYEFILEKEEVEEIVVSHLKDEGEEIPEEEVDIDIHPINKGAIVAHVHRKHKK